MPFADLIVWVVMIMFLIGIVFVLEKVLSSVFGFFLLIISSVYFATYFWVSGAVVFGILFAAMSLLAIRFLIGKIPNGHRW